MGRQSETVSPLLAALLGLSGLAVAMGIGRFAFTPMLPLMQMSDMVTLQQGSYLASANYIGYLLGAVACFAIGPRPGDAARYGLLGVAVSTLAMAAFSSFSLWMAARLFAGVASAFVLVGVSAWSLAVLTAHGRATWSGWVFAGVGVGIVAAGMVALAIGAMGLPAWAGWLALGAVASAVTLPVLLRGAHFTAESSALRAAAPGFDATAWRLIVCYGIFGFGYIIPATFLPAAARALVDDPAVFGWTWPVFGAAASVSTVVGGAALRGLSPRLSMALGHTIMAVGVALPAIDASLASMIVSALCVGGTFMLITMMGMQEARRVGGQSAPRLMAAMTAAFATGQLAGPLLVAGGGSAAEAIRHPSLLAAALLFVTALALLPGSRQAAKRHDPDSATRRMP